MNIFEIKRVQHFSVPSHQLYFVRVNAAPENSSTESQDVTKVSNESENLEATLEESNEYNANETAVPPKNNFTCKSVGRFAFPNSCKKYYFCWDTQTYAEFTCSDNKAFDPNTMLCVPNFAVCESAPRCECDQQIYANHEDNSSFFECKLHYDVFELQLHIENCAKGREFVANLGYCKLTSPDTDDSLESNSSGRFECHEPGIFSDILDKTKYYECFVKNVARGTFKAIHRKCPKNHVFNLTDRRCIPCLNYSVYSTGLAKI